MKKILVWFLVFVMVLPLAACGKGQKEGEETETKIVDNYPGQYRVGYARTNISPETSTPVAGLGNVNQRMSNDLKDPLYMTCIAFTGTNDETVLMYSIDNQFSVNTAVFPLVMDDLAKTVGIPKENIVHTCTHTHCAPEAGTQGYYGQEQYNKKVGDKIIPLAVEAMNDRLPATLRVGDIEAPNMNFVKHYFNTLPDGTKEYFGDNFGTASVDATTQHTLDADHTVHLLTIDREGKKQIVVMNFRAHPHFYIGKTNYMVTGDAVSYVREAVELRRKCDFVYFQGAAGNCNCKSYISSETASTDAPTYGRIMADYVDECLANNMEDLKTGKVKLLDQVYQAEANHSMDDMYVHAREIQAIWTATNDNTAVKEAGAPYGIRSAYHANAIVSNYKAGPIHEMDIKAFQLCDDLAWCTSPGEPFSESGQWVEDNSPYKHTFYNGYTNGGACYLPSEYCFTYTSYETDVTKAMPGTAEKVNAEHVKMLNELKNQ